MRGWRVAAVIGLSGLALMVVPGGAGAASRGADKRIAEAGLLTAADFPAGWTQAPDDSSSDREVEAVAKKISSCKRYLTLRAKGKQQPRAESPNFELNDSWIDNSVAVFPATASANAAVKLFEHSSVLRCIDRLFTDVLETQLAADPDTRDTITGVDLELRPNPLADVGDRAHAYEGNVVLEGSDGSQATAGLGIAAIRVGRAVSIYSYFVDAEEVLQVLPVVVDASVLRLGDALT